MVTPDQQPATYHHAHRPETWPGFATPTNTLFALETLEEIANGKISDHYDGPREFVDFVDWGTHMMENLKSTTTEESARWHSNEDIPVHLKDKLTVIAFNGHPEVREKLKIISEIAPMAMTKPLEETVAERDVYSENVDEIMALAVDRFNQDRKANTVAVTLLRGGLRFEQQFVVNDNRRIRTDAKRLDFGDKMNVGFTFWEGLESVQGEDAPESVELAFVDDCGATFGTIQSAVYALQERHLSGEFPKIDKVRIYVTAAVQQGLVDMFANFEALGIEVEAVVGDIAYQLSYRYYLERAEGELKSDGTPFEAGAPFFGDMGHIMQGVEVQG